MPIHLGFPEPFEPDDYDDDVVGEDAPTSLRCAANVFDFPHKVGGTPLWLDRTRPAPADRLTCGVCGIVMPLLLQLYTPSESVPAAYFRVVYLFACKNGACHRASGQALKCLRAQLPASTPLWPSDDDYSAAASPAPPAPTCRVCGLAAPKRCARCRSAAYCCKDHQTADWTAGGHSRACSNTTAQTNPPAADATATTAPAGRSLRAVRASTLFPELEIVTEPEPGSDDGDATEPLLERLRISRPLGDADTDAAAAAEADADLADADETVSDVDRAFLKFQKRVAREPAQVLRCARLEDPVPGEEPPEPLWVADDGRVALGDVPPCPLCNSPRSFEFQVMPQLLNHLGTDDRRSDALDFGTLVVFSCAGSCAVSDGYADEVVVRQEFSAAGMGDSVRQVLAQRQGGGGGRAERSGDSMDVEED